MRLTPCLLMALLLTLTLILPGCASSAPKVNTRVDPPTVRRTDHFTDTTESEIHKTHISINPATQPGGDTRPAAITLAGRQISAPAGAAVDVEIDDSKPAAATVHDQEAEAAGPTYRGDGDFSKAGISMQAPELGEFSTSNTGVAGGGSKGRSASSSGGSAMITLVAGMAGAMASSAGANWMMGLGIIFLLITFGYIAVEIFMKQKPDTALCVIGGVAGLFFVGLSLAVEKYPGLLMLIPLFIILAIVGYVLYWKFGKHVVVDKTATVTVTAPPTP